MEGRRSVGTRLKTYISQNLKRSEVLDFMQRDFPQYRWSLPTLDRRLRHFFTSLFFYTNYDTPLAAVSDAVQKELDRPGRLLGYRAMNQKLRTEHNEIRGIFACGIRNPWPRNPEYRWRNPESH